MVRTHSFDRLELSQTKCEDLHCRVLRKQTMFLRLGPSDCDLAGYQPQRPERAAPACTVYYDPSNPKTSALSTRPTTGAIWFMIGFGFLGLLHLIGGILLARDATLPNVLPRSDEKCEDHKVDAPDSENRQVALYR